MGTNSVGTAETGQEQLLNELQSLLKRQMELVRESDFRACELLAEKADSLVEHLKSMKTPEKGDLRRQFEGTTKLYRKAILIMAAEKDRLSRQLGQVKQGRKTLKAYRGRS